MINLKPLDVLNFETFAMFLGGCEFGGCYCAVWASHDETWVSRCSDPARPNLEITRNLVNAGSHVGFLAYDGRDELVGWTGSGPKDGFPFLALKLASRLTPSSRNSWSIGCLAVKATARGNKVAEKIAAAVVAKAKVSGATVIEAYPTRPWDEPRSFRGSWTMYQRLGFEIAASERDEESDILLMRLALSTAKLNPIGHASSETQSP